MSIATELENYNLYLTDAYNVCEDKGSEMPEQKNLQNLSECIRNMPIGGDDYKRLGTTVTVEATGGISKGATWVGVHNDENSQLKLSSQSISKNGAVYFSKDVSIGYGSSYSITKTTTSITIWLWNEASAAYDSISVDLSSVNSELSTTAITDPYVSDDGTLVMFCASGVSSILFLEIDKENKIVTPYVKKFKYTITSSSARPLFFGGKYIVVHCPKTTDSSKNAGLDFYEYDVETHSMNYLNRCDCSSSANFVNTRPTPKVTENTWLTIDNTNTLYKFVFDNSTFSYAKGTNLSSPTSFDGQHFTRRTSGYTMALYKINIQDLTAELVTSHAYSSNTPWYISGTILLDGTNAYDISGGAYANWVTLATDSSSGLGASNMRSGWNSNKWISGTKIYGFPSGSGSQFLISPATNPSMEAGKFYGIASKTLSLGDVDEAQLLFIGG